MARPNVVFQASGCLPSLHSVSADDGTVSGWKSRGDSRDNRSSTPPEAFEPPLASVEGKAYNRRESEITNPLRGRVKSPPNQERYFLPSLKTGVSIPKKLDEARALGFQGA